MPSQHTPTLNCNIFPIPQVKIIKWTHLEDCATVHFASDDDDDKIFTSRKRAFVCSAVWCVVPLPMPLAAPCNAQLIRREVFSSISPSWATNARSGTPSPAALSPQGGVGTLKPGTKLSGPVDITMSPTYQMIHGDEWRDIKKMEHKEHRPAQNHLFTIQHDGNSINAFGAPKGRIQQSNSFKTIMSTVMTPKLL